MLWRIAREVVQGYSGVTQESCSGGGTGLLGSYSGELLGSLGGVALELLGGVARELSQSCSGELLGMGGAGESRSGVESGLLGS